LYNILLSIDNEYVVNIILGRLLRIVSGTKTVKENINKTPPTNVGGGYDLGRDLLNHYYYTLYTRKALKLREEKAAHRVEVENTKRAIRDHAISIRLSK
jgi:hypothetical protein